MNRTFTALRPRPTRAVIEVDAIVHNLHTLRAVAPHSRIMAILKADAYGHGVARVARLLTQHGVRAFAVAYLEEGIALRQHGIEGMILVLGAIADYQIQHFIENDLDLTASSPYKAERISKVAQAIGRPARVHFKIDTGMRRIGVRRENALNFITQACALPGLCPVGLFSHFAGADHDPKLTEQQLQELLEIRAELQRRGIELQTHLANSAAILSYPASHLDLIRPGIALYGCRPKADMDDAGLRPAMHIESQVAFVKGIRKGQGVGYGHLWHAPEDGWLATIPVGYGDGYPRRLSNRAELLIKGRRYPVVGAISMDQCTVWLKKERCEVGEAVVLMGRQGQAKIDAWELAAHAETIAYEILCGWTGRVPRIYR